MLIERKKGEVKRNVGYARVGLEDGEQAEQGSDDEKGLGPHANCQPTHIACQMQPENAQEKRPERVKNLDEEIPPQADVRCEVGY